MKVPLSQMMEVTLVLLDQMAQPEALFAVNAMSKITEQQKLGPPQAAEQSSWNIDPSS